MFKTIIVGADGRDGGRDALALAQRLAGPATRLIAAGISTGTTSLADAQRAVGTLHDADGGVATVTRVATAVGVGISEIAQAEGADLVVVGACHRGPVGRVLLGDDSAAVICESDVPVAIAPRDFAQEPSGPITDIVVGVDGTAASTRAKELAAQLGEEHGATVEIVEAVAYPWQAYETYPYAPVNPPDSAYFDEAQQLVKQREGDTAVAEFGSAVGVLRREGEHAGMIVVGHASRTHLAALFDAATGARVAAGCRCPVLVVPA